MEVTLGRARPEADGADVLEHFGIGGGPVPVEQGEYRVEMHVGPVPRHHARDDPFGGFLRPG